MNASAARAWWAAHGETALRVACALSVVAAVPRLAYETWRLLFEPDRHGAIDLQLFHTLVIGWFSGTPIYETLRYASYPPATYALLWPLLGWLSVAAARWLWLATSVVLLLWLLGIVARESGATTRTERAFVVLAPLASYASAIAIGNGQIILHTLTPLIAGLLLLHRSRGTWRDDVIAALLILIALAKPSVSAPFFWLVLAVPGRLRPALLVVSAYAVLTLISAAFQSAGLAELFAGWIAVTTVFVGTAGHANVHIWLARIGLDQLSTAASLIMLFAAGAWSWRHRRADIWLLLGVIGLVARLWTYHRAYDDALVFPAMIALFRTAKRGPLSRGDDVAAAVLLALLWVLALAPASLLAFPQPWPTLFELALSCAWLATLALLVRRVRDDERAVATVGAPLGVSLAGATV